MSMGGRSLHKKDWLTLAAAAAAATTGAGALGMGPMAGLLGGAELGAAGAGAGLGASGLAEMNSLGAATPGIQGLLRGPQVAKGLLGMGKMMVGMGQQKPVVPSVPMPGGAVQQVASTQVPGMVGLSGNVGGMPPELIGLPPSDPRVQAWMLKQKMIG